MKTHIEIEIPKDQISEFVEKQIKALSRANATLKKQVTNLKNERDKNRLIVEKAKRIVEAVKDAGDFHEADGCYGDGGCDE